MVRFFCNKCGREIDKEEDSLNVTITIPKVVHQRPARGNLHLQCAHALANDLHLPMPVELSPTKEELREAFAYSPRNDFAYSPRNERDVKRAAKEMQPARTWRPGNNK